MGGTRDGKWMGENLSVKVLKGRLFIICVWMSLVVNPTMGPKLESTKGMGHLTRGGAFKEGFDHYVCNYFIIVYSLPI